MHIVLVDEVRPLALLHLLHAAVAAKLAVLLVVRAHALAVAQAHAGAVEETGKMVITVIDIKTPKGNEHSKIAYKNGK